MAKKNTALTAAETKLETLKAHQSNQQEHIGVLQTSIQTKEQHIKNLQGEVTQQWLLFSLLLLQVVFVLVLVVTVLMVIEDDANSAGGCGGGGDSADGDRR